MRAGQTIRKASATLRQSFFVLLLGYLLWPPHVLAELPRLPEATALTLMFKAMTFDHSFEERTGSEVVLVVLYQKRFNESSEAYKQVKEALLEPPFATIAGRTLSVHFVAIDQQADWPDEVLKLDADLLLITPLRGQAISDLASLSQARTIGTMSLVPEYVNEGLALSVTVENDRPKLYINLAASRAEGSEFSAQLLKLARLVE